MRLFFPLLLLSLPLLLLLGLSDAAPVEETNLTEQLGPPGKCDKYAAVKPERCTSDKPYCLLSFKLAVDHLHDPEATHEHELISCIDSSIGEGCMVQLDTTKYYCFCDSRKETLCSGSREIRMRLQAVAVAQYLEAHSTTLSPTTTTHRCLKDSDPLVACLGSYFCHSKIFYDRGIFKISNRTGLGCVEKLPDETLKDSCRKVDSFNTSDPIFECFCPSEVGRACNALDEHKNKARKDKWDKEVGAMMVKEIVEEEKNKETEERKNKGEKNGAFPFVAVFGSAAGISILILFAVGGCVAFFFYCKGNLDRQLKKIARSILATVMKNCDPTAMMPRWRHFADFTRNDSSSKLIPEKGTKKVLEGVLVRYMSANRHFNIFDKTAVDTKLPDHGQMPWNFVDDEKLFIAAQCPNKPFLGEFFLSLVRANVKCVVQLTQCGEEMKPGTSTDYLPFDEGALEQMNVGNTTIDVRISVVQDKKSNAYRKLHITVKSDEGGKDGTYVVDHFHYQDWTEQDIPAERAVIIDVAYMAFKASTYTDKRLLVHCRDGIGRTGAFLLAQILLKKAFQKIELTTDSVLEQAESIRMHRWDAIKPPTQLSFALFIVAGVIMKAADATSEEALFFKKFSDSLSEEMTREDKERARKAMDEAVRAAKEAAREAGWKAAMYEAKKDAKYEAELAAKKAAKAAKKAAEEKEAGGGGGEKDAGGGNE